MSLLSWLKQNTARDDAWITVHPNSGTGRPVLLDDEGYIKGGMGGKFNGQRIDLIPRQNQGLKKELSGAENANKSMPGFLRTERYTLKAPQNVASQATFSSSEKLLSEIKKTPTLKFEKGSADEKFTTAPVEDLIREIAWDNPAAFYLNGMRDSYKETLKKIKTLDDKAVKKELQNTLETSLRNQIISEAYDAGKLSPEFVEKIDVSDTNATGRDRYNEQLKRWGETLRQGTNFFDLNKQVRDYVAQKKFDDLAAKSTFPVVATPKVKEMLDKGIKYNEVKLRSEKLTDDQIITRLAGGDETKGSCASVALAYIGQKNGYDVGDFRGGKSREFLSHAVVARNRGKPDEIFNDWGANVIRSDNISSSNLKNAQNVLDQLTEGKEYYFIAGKHAAIVKKQDGRFKYLELQHPEPKENGWKPLSDENGDARKTLKWRFKCSNGTWGSSAVDVSEIKGDAFRTALGFLNTEENEQQRGKNGSVR